jgi:hypothetical protein
VLDADVVAPPVPPVCSQPSELTTRLSKNRFRAMMLFMEICRRGAPADPFIQCL